MFNLIVSDTVVIFLLQYIFSKKIAVLILCYLTFTTYQVFKFNINLNLKYLFFIYKNFFIFYIFYQISLIELIVIQIILNMLFIFFLNISFFKIYKLLIIFTILLFSFVLTNLPLRIYNLDKPIVDVINLLLSLMMLIPPFFGYILRKFKLNYD